MLQRLNMKICFNLLILFSLFISYSAAIGQTTTFNCTNASQTYTVPAGFTCVDVIVEGAQGGGPNGGLGALVTGQLTVTPGQVLQVNVGCRCTGSGTSFNGGGSGQGATSAGDPSFCGGGGSDIRIAPYGTGNRIVVAGGGGGTGGGTEDGLGGDGGCATGLVGAAPFGVGGAGGTQLLGGAGGPAWQAPGNTGFDGSFFVGGNGAIDPCNNNAPGGGGGGGYYGGGGGGSDCWGTAPYGGGGGGGGSSLVPAAGTCIAGSRSGQGRVRITPVSCTLPIELLSFTGKNVGANNELEWITSTEINNDYFVIEASEDGYFFQKIGEVNGAGNSTTEKEYQFIDYHPIANLTYYRLRQVDFDGKYSFSNTIALKMKQELDVNIYPNPTSGDFILSFNEAISGDVSITNSLGQIVYRNNINSLSSINVDLNVSQGLYYLKINTPSGYNISKKLFHK